MSEFSDIVVYVDESGNHGLESLDPTFPVFVLAFCVFRKNTYINQTVPAMQSFKFRHFGHDGVVLHEREIRKKLGPFSMLTQPEVASVFMKEITDILENQPFEVIACVIDKTKLRHQYAHPSNPYHLAMGFCIERLYRLLDREGALGGLTHVIFECRGKREDDELELEFRRVCDGQNFLNKRIPLEILLADKRSTRPDCRLPIWLPAPSGSPSCDPASRTGLTRSSKRSSTAPAKARWTDLERRCFREKQKAPRNPEPHADWDNPCPLPKWPRLRAGASWISDHHAIPATACWTVYRPRPVPVARCDPPRTRACHSAS